MKKFFCAILMLLLCVSCFAGTLYIKMNNSFLPYENVRMDDRSGPNIMIFWTKNGNKIVVATHSEWWYVE